MINVTISDEQGYVLDQFEISVDVKNSGATNNQLSNEVRDYLGFRFEIKDIESE